MDVDVSVVVPVFNEEPNLIELLARLIPVMEGMGRTFEVVVVDDGSSDGSVAVLKELQAKEPRLRIVQLARNFGQTPALYAGFAHARGGIVVMLDADLQNPPEEIPKLIAKIEEGYDVVQGWRADRKDTMFRRTASKVLNATISRLTGMEIRDLGCGLKAYRREVIDRLVRFKHHARYLPAEIVWLGVRIAEVPVAHRDRARGTSKYGLLTLLRLNFDMVTGVSSVPIKLIGLVGMLFSLVGFGMGARILYMRVLMENYDPLATVAALFFLIAGIQLLATGIMCEYVGRIFVEVQNKPYFIVKDVHEGESPK